MLETVLAVLTVLAIAIAPSLKYEVPEAHAARSNCSSCHSSAYLGKNATLTLEIFDD